MQVFKNNSLTIYWLISSLFAAIAIGGLGASFFKGLLVFSILCLIAVFSNAVHKYG